jgi:hypothetical protein
VRLDEQLIALIKTQDALNRARKGQEAAAKAERNMPPEPIQAAVRKAERHRPPKHLLDQVRRVHRITREPLHQRRSLDRCAERGRQRALMVSRPRERREPSCRRQRRTTSAASRDGPLDSDDSDPSGLTAPQARRETEGAAA